MSNNNDTLLPSEVVDYPVRVLRGLNHICPDCLTLLDYRSMPETNQYHWHCTECPKEWNISDLISAYNSDEFTKKVHKNVSLARITLTLTFNKSKYSYVEFINELIKNAPFVVVAETVKDQHYKELNPCSIIEGAVDTVTTGVAYKNI